MSSKAASTISPKNAARRAAISPNLFIVSARSVGDNLTVASIRAFIDVFWDYVLFAMAMIGVAFLLRRVDASRTAAVS